MARIAFLIALAVLFLLAVFGIFKLCKAEDVIVLNWFEMRTETYGPNTVTFNFFYWEDHDEDSYLGTINITHDGTPDGEWYVDEYVDLLPYSDPFTGEVLITKEEVFTGMIYFADNVLIMLNSQESAWPNGIPQDFQPHTDYWEVLMTLKPVIFTDFVWMPVVMNKCQQPKI